MADRNPPSDHHPPGPLHAPLMAPGAGSEGLGIAGPFAFCNAIPHAIHLSERADGSATGLKASTWFRKILSVANSGGTPN
jgi:hypothetical protein